MFSQSQAGQDSQQTEKLSGLFDAIRQDFPFFSKKAS
jgi:hypothetical protein